MADKKATRPESVLGPNDQVAETDQAEKSGETPRKETRRGKAGDEDA